MGMEMHTSQTISLQATASHQSGHSSHRLGCLFRWKTSSLPKLSFKNPSPQKAEPMPCLHARAGAQTPEGGRKAPGEGGTHPLGRIDEEHDAVRDAKAGCHLVRKIHMTFKTTQSTVRSTVRSTVSPGAAAAHRVGSWKLWGSADSSGCWNPERQNGDGSSSDLGAAARAPRGDLASAPMLFFENAHNLFNRHFSSHL